MKNERDTAGVLIRPPLLYAGALACGLLVDRAVRWPLPALPAGWVIGAAGIGLLFLGVREFRRAGTNVQTPLPATHLVMSGPYRFSRNPIYVGMTAAYAGFALGLGSAGALLLLPIVLAVLRVGVIAREERYLVRKFGDDYTSYQHRVRRWL